MEQKQIQFYNNNGQVVKALLKPFISADMLVETTKIIRKYSKYLELFTNEITADSFDFDKLSDTDFRRAMIYLNLLSSDADKSNLLNNIYKLYQQEIEKELLPIIIDIASISNKEIVEMLNNPDFSL